MSTPSLETDPAGETGAEHALEASLGLDRERAGRVVEPALRDDPSRPDGSAGGVSPEALAVAVSAFSDTFEHWSNRKAVEAGASIPRLRLLYAVHCHGPQKMADLAETLAVTPRNVTALVDGLESDGLVRRIPHSTDRRVTLVELTCNSERVAEQFGAYQASIASLFSWLDEDDQRTLLRLAISLHDRMHTQADCTPAEEAALDA
jgi:DNA-binding MarR family transcriptional regulator